MHYFSISIEQNSQMYILSIYLVSDLDLIPEIISPNTHFRHFDQPQKVTLFFNLIAHRFISQHIHGTQNLPALYYSVISKEIDLKFGKPE